MRDRPCETGKSDGVSGMKIKRQDLTGKVIARLSKKGGGIVVSTPRHWQGVSSGEVVG